jgi:hypothetical protein
MWFDVMRLEETIVNNYNTLQQTSYTTEEGKHRLHVFCPHIKNFPLFLSETAL